MLPARPTKQLYKRIALTTIAQRMYLAIVEARREKFLELQRRPPFGTEDANTKYEEYLDQEILVGSRSVESNITPSRPDD